MTLSAAQFAYCCNIHIDRLKETSWCCHMLQQVALCVRCPGWLIFHLVNGFNAYLLDTLCKFSFNPHKKTTQFPLIRAEQGLRSRKGALAFEDHVENADHCRQQRHELQRSYGHG